VKIDIGLYDARNPTPADAPEVGGILRVGATSDAETVSAIQTQTESAISVASVENGSQPKQIFKEVGSPRENFSWAPGGRIVYSSHAGGSWDIFIMEADGSNKKQLTNDPHDDIFPTVSADGKQIFFVSNRSGNSNIWRMETDGGSPVQLTHGTNETFPECSPDGKWVIFQRGDGAETSTVWKIPTGGGEPQPLPDRFAQRPTFSPDGKLLAYVSLEGESWRVKTVSFESGELLRSFPFPQNIASRNVRWTADGQNLAYIRNDGGVSNIWLQPLDGGPPRRLTDFGVDQITFFDWSPDGRTLAFAHTAKISDVVLLRNFR
jgi:Tol biopolymer transport system component